MINSSKSKQIPMIKDFDKWNEEKKRLHARSNAIFAHPREIWWCALGVNIGAETDGRSDNFERPVLIVRVYNLETLLALPMTGKEKSDPFHIAVRVPRGKSWVKLTQARVISNRRLLRKLSVLDEKEFAKVVKKLREYL